MVILAKITAVITVMMKSDTVQGHHTHPCCAVVMMMMLITVMTE